MRVSYIPKWDTIYRLNKMAADYEMFGNKRKARVVREVVHFLEEDTIEYISDRPLERKMEYVQK